MNNKTIIAVTIGIIIVMFAMSKHDGGSAVECADGGCLNMIIVEDRNSRGDLSPERLAILDSTILDEWAEKNCEPDGFHIFDDDDDVSHMPEKWQKAFEYAKKQPLPFLGLTDGKRGPEGDLPENLDKTLNELNKWVKKK